jgi:LPXTG-motif cell wall-anchored protein
MNRSSVALTIIGLLMIVGLLVFAVVNDTGEAVLIAAGVAMSGGLAAVISSRRRRPPTDQR